MTMADTIIGIGGLDVARGPNTLTTLGLGSCVGICLFDRVRKIGGMAHIMLPKSSTGDTTSTKYADVAFEVLLRKMIQAGANPALLIAKLAGGAHMFSSSVNNDIMKVGERNVDMCRQLLRNKPIAIVSEDTGGELGRTIILDCATGNLLVRTAWPRTEKVI